MSAGVHHATVLRTERHAGNFFYRQGVNIATQRNDRPLATADFGHYASLQPERQNTDTGLFQPTGEAGGRGKLMVGQLRVLMQFTAIGDDFFGQLAGHSLGSQWLTSFNPSAARPEAKRLYGYIS
ncbi:hypothetical protein D3C72_1598380 [compost metagenome]